MAHWQQPQAYLLVHRGIDGYFRITYLNVPTTMNEGERWSHFINKACLNSLLDRVIFFNHLISCSTILIALFFQTTPSSFTWIFLCSAWQHTPIRISFIGIPIVLRYLTAFMSASVKGWPALWAMIYTVIQCKQYRWALDRIGDLIYDNQNDCYTTHDLLYIMLLCYISWYYISWYLAIYHDI